MISIDFSAFSDYAEKLDKMGADLKSVFNEAMEEAGKQVANDTKKAVEDANLPAKGQFVSKDRNTENSIIENPKVRWQGSLGELPLGFDKTVQGHGGFLITGTPKMQPDIALERIYARKAYETKIKKLIEKKLQERIKEMEGKNGR